VMGTENGYLWARTTVELAGELLPALVDALEAAFEAGTVLRLRVAHGDALLLPDDVADTKVAHAAVTAAMAFDGTFGRPGAVCPACGVYVSGGLDPAVMSQHDCDGEES